MASRLLTRHGPRLTTTALRAAVIHPSPQSPLFSAAAYSMTTPSSSFLCRHLSTALRRHPSRPPRAAAADIGARARQLQNRRLWSYALTFSCVAGFIIIVLNNFQDQMVFYITPTDALEKFAANPAKNRFRLGGLVLEGSVVQPAAASPEMEFVITDLVTDILIRYEGSLPDLFREGHSAVVEGFLRPLAKREVGGDEEAVGGGSRAMKVSEKARTLECYFKATEVLAKHDEKYMPTEVAAALERNKKKLQAEAEPGDGAEPEEKQS